MNSELLTERRGTTLVMTLSDPATRNTLSPQACAAGVEALNMADSNADLRCVVLRGDGANFCWGDDLHRLARTREEGVPEQTEATEHVHNFVEALRTFSKPVIAAVEGTAAGEGFSLALACDLLVAAEDSRFVMSFGRLGLSPDGGASWQLAQRLPRSKVLEILWLGEPLGAREMASLGLVNRVSDSGQALADALRLAERLAQTAPNAVTSVKELINQAPQRSLREQLDCERDHFVQNLFHDNGAEGLQAFFDKRAPKFRKA